MLMKLKCFARYFLIASSMLFFASIPVRADFTNAAKLLTAARNGDTRTVDALVRSGADINYVDSTGLSIVCTAIRNNDTRTSQILQAYGADASKCDQQIKKYNKKQASNKYSTGFFNGLSTPQNMTLLVGGAAVAVGGVVLLSSSSSDSSSSTVGNTGTHTGTTTTTPTTTTVWSLGALPYGPSGTNYKPDFYSTAANLPYSEDFAYMSEDSKQNYLLLMHGYSPLARGYLGQTTFRLGSTGAYAPVEVLNATGGGRPILTALITNNGINPTGSAIRGNIDYATSSAVDSTTYAVDKYYNNAADGGVENTIFDLSGYGTVFNDYASGTESSLAKIIAGWEYGGRATGDFYGFAPNSQLVVYRTGGGNLWTEDISGDVLGAADSDAYDTITLVNIGGTDYTATYDGTDGTFTVDGAYGFTGTVGADDLLYVDAGGGATNVYSLDGSGNLVIAGQLTAADYLNFQAMLDAANLGGVGNRVVNVIANSALIQPMRSISSATINDALVLTSIGTTTSAKQQIFLNLLNNYYNQNTSDTSIPGNDAGNLFGGMGSSWSPILIFSTGEFNWGLGEGESLSILDATFENMAPSLWSNLNHLFMSVVAVQTEDGTDNVSSVTGLSTTLTGKITLSSYFGDDGNTYASRACGMAGKGTSSVDPWCFAAAGGTGEQAVSAMAGAVATIKGAFSYMSSGQIFTLLALTSDGTLLAASNTNGTPQTEAELISYLQAKYILPPEFQARVDGGEDYLNVFSEVYGYGLVNLERATTPSTSIYYATGTSTIGAQWRSASASTFNSTVFSLSGAFGSRNASLSLPVWDTLESADGSLTLPRVFESDFGLSSGRRGIFLTDVLGDFSTEKNNNVEQTMNGFSTSMKFSESNRTTNMNGLDEMSFGYESGDWKLNAEYKHHLNDADNVVLRGDGSNPILSLASDAVSSGVSFGSGAWNFGMKAFSGKVTDEQLLEYDPVISGTYESQKLGFIQGAESAIGYKGNKFALKTSMGTVHENNTILGTYSDGLMGLGGGDTIYIDSIAMFAPTDSFSLTARATFANTSANPNGDVILGLSEIQSDAFAISADYKNWSFAITQPLAVRKGNMEYATMDYEIVETSGGYELNTTPYIANFDLAPNVRETRFSLAYRARLGAMTTGALGFVYRVNPDNTDQFGNESIFMLKIKHSVGI